MKRRRGIKVFIAAVFILALVVAMGGFYLSHANRQSAIETTIDWARLAPLPSSAQNLQINVKGSPLTREFIITFDASPTVIQQWLTSSPGPASVTPTVVGTLATYSIVPGSGAQFAEVKVDHATGNVVIRTYWS